MTLLEGLRLYPKAIAWSVLISSCCAMEGYDISLLGNFCKFHSLIYGPHLRGTQMRLTLLTENSVWNSTTVLGRFLHDGKRDCQTVPNVGRSLVWSVSGVHALKSFVATYISCSQRCFHWTIWLPKGSYSESCLACGCYHHLLLRSQHSGSPCRWDFGRYSLGCLPVYCHFLCQWRLPYRSSWLVSLPSKF